MAKPEISIVIPAYNEEQNVLPLYSELKAVLDKLGKSWEIIYVDDGSKDGTFDEAKQIHARDGRFKVIRFQKNFKKSAALKAGFDASSGNVILTMDADLQDEPTEIPRFLEALKYYDIVVGWKYPRKDPFTKILPSRVFNLLVRRLTGVKTHDTDNNFRAIKRKILPHLNFYGGLFRYIPVLAHWKGFKVGEIKVKHNPRRFGKSKWGASRLFKGFFDLLTIKYIISYSESPGYFFGMLGSGLLGLGMLAGLCLLYIKFLLGEAIGGRPLLTLTLLLLVLGVQFFSMGFIAEMLARMTKRKETQYIIKEFLN